MSDALSVDDCDSNRVTPEVELHRTNIITDMSAFAPQPALPYGAIDATLRGGDLLLHLPQEAQYTIDAKADAGHVNSDYPGEQKRRSCRIGHEIVTKGPPSSHKLNLRVGVGDIIILKTQTPEAPRPLASVPTERGQ